MNGNYNLGKLRMLSEQNVNIKILYFDKTKLGDYFRIRNSIGKILCKNKLGHICCSHLPMDRAEGLIHLVGPRATRIVEFVLPCLLNEPLMKGTVIEMIYGSEDDDEAKLEYIQLD